jgi:hypothetical protein
MLYDSADDLELFVMSHRERSIVTVVFFTALSSKLLSSIRPLGDVVVIFRFVVQQSHYPLGVAACITVLNLLQPLLTVVLSVAFSLLLSGGLVDVILNFLAFEFLATLDELLIKELISLFFNSHAVELELQIPNAMKSQLPSSSERRDLQSSELSNADKWGLLMDVVSGFVCSSIKLKKGIPDPPPSYWKKPRLHPQYIPFLNCGRWMQLKPKQKTSLLDAQLNTDAKKAMERYVLCDLYTELKGSSWSRFSGWLEDDNSINRDWDGGGWDGVCLSGGYGTCGRQDDEDDDDDDGYNYEDDLALVEASLELNKDSLITNASDIDGINNNNNIPFNQQERDSLAETLCNGDFNPLIITKQNEHLPCKKESKRQSVGEKRKSEIMGQSTFQGVDGNHSSFNLKIIFEPNKTGFEEAKNFNPSKGNLLI